MSNDRKAYRRAYYLVNKEKIGAQTKAWKKANAEKVLAQARRWIEENPERHKAIYRRWRAANLEKARAASLNWMKSNPGRRNAAAKVYREAHPEKVKALNTRRRLREVCVAGTHTGADRIAVLGLQKHRCAYCRADLKKNQGTYPSGRKRPCYHIDHIVPIAGGGTNDRVNLQAVCPSCNSRKHAKDPIAFARELGRLL